MESKSEFPQMCTLQELKCISAKIGCDPSLIQATGGNTSIKEGNLLWVKASGKNLSSALNEEIFVGLELSEVTSKSKVKNKSEPRFNVIQGPTLRPSIETSLHGLMPHKVVLHTHSIDIIAASMHKNGKAQMNNHLKGIKWKFIEYCRPGKPLADAIAAAMEKEIYDVLILENHGLIVGAKSIKTAIDLQSDIIKRSKQACRRYENNFNINKLRTIAESIQNARIPDESIIHSLATDSCSFQLTKLNPYCPDHLVFCGVRPWIMSASEPIPRQENNYGIIPGIGVILLGSATIVTEAMLKAQAEVFLRIPEKQKVNVLSDSQCGALLNWDAEKYRQSLVKDN